MAKIPIVLEAGRADGKLATSNSIFDENKGMFQSEINDIQDTLNSDNPNKPLSAKQGKVLKELLDAKVIEIGAIPIDTEPIEGNTTHVVNSDGLAKEFNKCNTAKIAADRIEDGAVTSEKIAISAVDDTPIAGSNKLVKSGGVYAAIASKSEMSLINEDGFHIVDENLNVGMKYNENGLDISKASSHFIEVLKASGINVDNIISSYASLTNEDGFFIIDEELNIGVKVDNNGIHAKNILEYEIIEN